MYTVFYSPYFVLGGIAEEVEFTASVAGEMIMIGESLVVPSGQSVEISVSFIESTPHDSIELIGNPNGQVQVVAKVQGSDLAHSAGRTTWMTEVSMGSDPFYLRARGSAFISQPYPVKAWFYTKEMKTDEWAAWWKSLGDPQPEMIPEEVGSTLREQGLSHDKEDARYAAITVLANLGEEETLISALDDASGMVRLAAAKALLATRWAEGWAACGNHSDAAVRALIAPLLKPAGEDVLLRTYVITELMDGLESASADTRSFCQNALERVTGQKLEGRVWSDWWKKLGNAQPGIMRTGPGVPSNIDEQIDFGIWWQSGLGSIQHCPNPMVEYQLPATIEWRGYIVVTQPGQYQFYVRNRGESIRSARRIHTPGRYSFPAYFPDQLVKLEIDGRTVLPRSDADVVEDPSAWMRLDFTSPIRLKTGLHEIRLEFSIRSYDDADSASNAGIWGGTPCIRLYWSSEHFLRELLSLQHLITFKEPELRNRGYN